MSTRRPVGGRSPRSVASAATSAWVSGKSPGSSCTESPAREGRGARAATKTQPRTTATHWTAFFGATVAHTSRATARAATARTTTEKTVAVAVERGPTGVGAWATRLDGDDEMGTVRVLR